LAVEEDDLAVFIASNSARLNCPSLFVSSFSKSGRAAAFDFALLAPADALPEALAAPLCDMDGFDEDALWAFFASPAACAAKASREKLRNNGVTNLIRAPEWVVERSPAPLHQVDHSVRSAENACKCCIPRILNKPGK